MAGWNVATTRWATLRSTVQTSPLGWGQPVQSVNVDFASGSAVSVTSVPVVTVALQVPVEPLPQEMGPPLTVPPPEPITDTVSVVAWKVAVTVFAAVIATVQEPPETCAHPDHDLRYEVVSAVATSVTVSPFACVAVQPDVAPGAQAIPAPLTLPAPVPARTAVSA